MNYVSHNLETDGPNKCVSMWSCLRIGVDVGCHAAGRKAAVRRRRAHHEILLLNDHQVGRIRVIRTIRLVYGEVFFLLFRNKGSSMNEEWRNERRGQREGPRADESGPKRVRSLTLSENRIPHRWSFHAISAVPSMRIRNLR